MHTPPGRYLAATPCPNPSEHAQASRLRELARAVAEYVDGNGADDYPLWAAIEQLAQIGRQEA